MSLTFVNAENVLVLCIARDQQEGRLLGFREDCLASSTKINISVWDFVKLMWHLRSSSSEWLMKRSSWDNPSSHFCFHRGLCYDLYHCERIIITLLTVISCKVFRLQAADGERIICPRPTATEPWWDPICQVGCPIDQELRSLPWFLLEPL